MNILVSPLPRSVPVDGVAVPLRTDHRGGIAIMRVAESSLADQLKAAAILRIYYGDHIPEDKTAALEVALEFHRCGKPEPKKRRRGSGNRAMDWDHDAGTVLADFRREYDIDLGDPATSLHWWTFMAYFDNLSGEAEIKRAMYYRTASPKGLKGDDLKRFHELRRAYALPARTVEEFEAQQAELWG